MKTKLMEHKMNLKSIFSSIAYKELVQVDLPNVGSNQHEINGVSTIRSFFSDLEEKEKGKINWHYFSDEVDSDSNLGEFTFYDARAKSYKVTGRSEWRLYYSGDFLSKANVGDVLVLARPKTGSMIHGLIFKKGSAWLRVASSLFGIKDIQEKLQIVEEQILDKQEIDLALRKLLEELDINILIPVSDQALSIAEEMLQLALKDGREFPSTKSFAEIAQNNTEGREKDPDELLVTWLLREEEIFKSVEKIIIEKRIKKGFDTVEEFISYSLSVQNRRKARMGYALQNHLTKIFEINKLKFESQKITERKNKPDFLFPSQERYLDQKYNADFLTMLAAKSTCKDRWRQILTEAERINIKHLCTLEQTITKNQTDEMENHNVILVIPYQFHKSFDDEQKVKILSLKIFISTVLDKQSRS
jgi:hypothetical protein